MELLEVSSEPGGEGGPRLADGRAYGECSTGSHGTSERNHPEEASRAMTALANKCQRRLYSM